ncbi:ENTH-domain-containing protein [Neolentinus lepideus HHB14362 ss-1]|uniref:ENTH-domain-containing protein n=1 Tax=Neolentinus lepideus HHB14362 ss-1 TaxID=1314782 RepID=A0A165UUV6_9AGAM|nr:ENTH-domain-containing protein [Neolentinus lepideus HHB14362 ss-1]
MDRLENLANQLSQVTVYDLKSMYNQAKNMVLNVSEMEAKVREATNDEPWGASSTLMQEIAQGCDASFHSQNFNEIMPAIYSKFMEKEARQWREIYKALQLLEYLIKNGSERVVDDARSHISTLKMLRSFHYIDDKGKDQGLNVRNRAKEIVELLSDVEKIRLERRKAKANRSKYTGTGNDAMSFTSGGSRYGGFGSDSYSGGGSSSYGGGYDRDYGSGYAGGGSSSGGFRDGADRHGFEEYDAGDDEDSAPRRSNSVSQRTSAPPRRSNTLPAPAPPAKEKESEKMVDLLGLDDDFTAGASATTTAASVAPAPSVPPVQTATSNSLFDDDDFGDFSAAPVAPTAVQTSPPVAPVVLGLGSLATQKPAVAPMAQPPNMFGNATVLSPTLTGNRSSLSMSSLPLAAAQNNSFFSSQPLTPASQPLTPASPPPRSSFASPISATARSGATTPATAKSSGSGAFDDIWNMSLGSATGSRSGTPANSQPVKKSIKDLEKEKAQSGIWGAKHSSQGSMGGFGAFGAPSKPTANTNASSSGLDDLLL